MKDRIFDSYQECTIATDTAISARGTTRLCKLLIFRHLAKYIFYAGVSQNDNISKIDDVYTLIDNYIMDGVSIEELQNLTIETLYTSGILSKQMYDASKKMAGKQQEALQKLLK